MLNRLKLKACKAYMREGFMYTSKQIATNPLPEGATLKMRWYRFLLILFGRRKRT
jgi:hypothetical protein